MGVSCGGQHPRKKLLQRPTSLETAHLPGVEAFTDRDETTSWRNGVSLLGSEGAMDRRKFMKQSLAPGMAPSGTVRLDAGNSFAADAPTGLGRSVTLAAKPTPITFDIAKTVVMVVDMQNDFGSKGGMFDRAGLDISIIQRAVPPTAKVLAAAR